MRAHEAAHDAFRRGAEASLLLSDLHPALGDQTLDSMGFLNEIADRYPEAISFAPGRPYEQFYDLEDIPRYLERFLRHCREEKGLAPEATRRLLFQYGRTKGIIHDLLAQNLRLDEGIVVDPESLVVTVGCQEAILITTCALCGSDRDDMLAVNPTYVGFTGAAALFRTPVLPVRETPDGIDLEHLVAQVRSSREAGRRPLAFYVVPDFANPSGVTLSLEQRHALIGVAEEQDFLILEDNPYRLFGDPGDRLPTLKSLDRAQHVVYLGSLSKSAFPGVRIGYVVADQTVVRPDRSRGTLANELAKVKSMVTVNTSPIAQAVAGGLLLEHGGSLVTKNSREIQSYRRSRSTLLAELSRAFGGVAGITWNTPAGGFFVVLTLPFVVDAAALEECADEHGVLWTPMSDFFRGEGGRHQLRLSCSTLRSEEVVTGVERLACFVASRTYIARESVPAS